MNFTVYFKKIYSENILEEATSKRNLISKTPFSMKLK